MNINNGIIVGGKCREISFTQIFATLDPVKSLSDIQHSTVHCVSIINMIREHMLVHV